MKKFLPMFIIFLVIKMAEKDTAQLENELSKSENIEDFFNDNKEFLKKFSLAEYLEYLLAEKNLNKIEIIQKSFLNELYAYHIFAGRKKNPSREKIILLAFAMNLSIKETQRLLYFSGNEKLYVKNSWDSIILFALENSFTVERTNDLLLKFSERPLIIN